MTVSTHVYSAWLTTDPEVELSVRGGRITLDSGVAPHVQGEIEIAWPDEATLDALDPRDGVRIRVEVDGTYPSFSTTREFDLGLRDREVRHASGVVTLSLAGDEALLEDYAPLTDDLTPRTYEASLRAVVNYVLNKAIPGAALEASPSVDANVTAYWELSNLIPDPSVATISNYTAAGGVGLTLSSASALYGTTSALATSTGSGTGFTRVTASFRASAGQVFTASVYGRSNAAGRNGYVRINALDSTGATIASWDGTSTSLTTSTSVWTRLSRTTPALPAGTEQLQVFAAGVYSASSQLIYWDGFMLTEGAELVPWFAGSTTADSHYTYAWTGTGNASASTRTPVVERLPESLTWKAGQSALDFMHPLVQAAGYRLVCDEERKWTLRSEDYTAAGSLSIRHAVNLIDGTDMISRESGTWFDAAVTTYTWTDRGVEKTRVDSYALSGTPTRTQTFEKTTAYPGAGFSEYAVRRAQGRGREVTATSVADWRAHAEQGATVVLEGAPTLLGNTQRVEFDLDNDRMTATLRTTDTPDGAINLLAGTINALAGTINAL